MNFTIQLERIEYMANEIVQLHLRHFAETESTYLTHPFRPDYTQYAQLEQEGRFRCYVMRSVTGQMIGYVMYFTTQSLHGNFVDAQEDAFYIVPEFRGKGLARPLLRFAEADLAKYGVNYVYMSSKAPVGGPDTGPFFEKEGYREMARVYCKRLES